MRYAAARNESLMSALSAGEQACFMACIRKLHAHVGREYTIEGEGRSARSTSMGETGQGKASMSNC